MSSESIAHAAKVLKIVKSNWLVKNIKNKKLLAC